MQRYLISKMVKNGKIPKSFGATSESTEVSGDGLAVGVTAS